MERVRLGKLVRVSVIVRQLDHLHFCGSQYTKIQINAKTVLLNNSIF